MYTASTAANRLRPSGRTGRRVAAALVAAAALGLGATACGQDDGSANGAASSNSSASSSASNSSNASASQHDSASAESGKGSSGGSSNNAAAQGQHSGTSPAKSGTGGKAAPEGSGVANAGNHRLIEGKMSYLAPGKLMVKPDDGGKPVKFEVANAVEIRGAAAICGGADGTVTIGKDGYGTKRCDVDQLEKAAKTDSVVVRVTMDTTSDIAVPDLVEEKYHP